MQRLGESCLARIRVTKCRGCVAEFALDRVACGLHGGKIRLEIGFTSRQTRNVGQRGLMVALRRGKRRFSGCEPLFDRRAV